MRPPSPLRQQVTTDSEDEDEDADRAPSFSRYAADFARSVGSLMSPTKSTQSLPSDAELEAEAERERDRSRREAERIILREARDRKLVEERVLAMLQDHSSLPPPPPRVDSNPPSPSGSQRESSWWSSAKARLTPTKEPLTESQQIVQITKAREKAQRKADRAAEKAEKRAREQQWPAKGGQKYTDPAFAALTQASASASTSHSPQVGHGPSGSGSAPATPPHPPARRFSTPASLNASPAGPASAREGPPIYAQFDEAGTLDVHGTLLLIARRFEKLEKWSVGHVRALEERMSDVERWLVDKEKEREDQSRYPANGSSSRLESELEVMREEMAELQGRIGTLGREMAKAAAATATATRSTATPPLTRNGSSSFVVRSIPPYGHGGRTQSEVSGRTTSPPTTSSAISGTPSARTRLPYPTGDYASPTNSPPPGVASPPILRSVLSNSSMTGSDYAGPMATGEYALPPPNAPALSDSPRAGSVSPTPRKRYTVALGQSITASREDDGPLPVTPSVASARMETAYFSDSPRVGEPGADSDSDADFAEETIGKSAARRVSGKLPSANASPSPAPSDFRDRRARAQSAYGFGSIAASNDSSGVAPSETPPLRVRARSTERFGTLPSASASTSNLGLGISTDGSSRFVDPYLARKAEREREASAAPPTPKVMNAIGKKVPVGQLVAFFDSGTK
jgi:hypothetical protein